MTFELWMFSFLALFGIFLSFLILNKTYCFYLKCKWFMTDVLIYQDNFWCNQTMFHFMKSVLSWKVLIMTGFVFNIIIMTAFSAKFVALMSVRHYRQPFYSLKDFVSIRSHSLFVSKHYHKINFSTSFNLL